MGDYIVITEDKQGHLHAWKRAANSHEEAVRDWLDTSTFTTVQTPVGAAKIHSGGYEVLAVNVTGCDHECEVHSRHPLALRVRGRLSRAKE